MGTCSTAKNVFTVTDITKDVVVRIYSRTCHCNKKRSESNQEKDADVHYVVI